MARLPVIVLVLVLLIAPAAIAAPEDPGGTFLDDDGSTHEGGIEAVATAAITLGCDPAGTVFCPSESVTRAQMATFLARALELPDSATNHFTDDEGNTHEANINKVADAEISLGCGGTNYCPADPVTRAQMATFLARALELDITPAAPRPATTDGIGLSLFEKTAACSDVLDCPATESIPAGTAFYVSEGWNLDNWSISSDIDRDTFEADGTRAEYTWNGGDTLRSNLSIEVDASDTARKRHSFQFPDDLTGTHELEVRWYQNDVLAFRVIVEITIDS